LKATGVTEFGKFLRALRILRDEKQEDTAEILGCTKSYLSTVELGKQPVPSGWVEKLIQAYELNDNDANRLKSLVLDITRTVKIDTTTLSVSKKHLAINLASKIGHMQDDVASELNDTLLRIEGHDMSAMGGWETQSFRLLVGDGSYYSHSGDYPKSMFIYYIGYKGEDGALVDCRFNPKKVCIICESENPEMLRQWSQIEPHTICKMRANVNSIRGLVDSRSFNAELLDASVSMNPDEQKLLNKYLSQMTLKGDFGEVIFNRVKWWFKGSINFNGQDISVRIDRRIDGEKYFGMVYNSLTSTVQKFKETLEEQLKNPVWLYNAEQIETKTILSELRLAKIDCVSEYGYNVEFNFRDSHIAGAFVTFAAGATAQIAGFHMGLNHGLEPLETDD